MRLLTVSALIAFFVFIGLQLMPRELMEKIGQDIVIFGLGGLVILAGIAGAFADHWNRNKRGNTP